MREQGIDMPDPQ
jgi:hypothetical protein